MNTKGMNVEITRSLRQETHYHPDIELYFIVDGSARIKVRNQEYDLGAEDVLLVNSSEMHVVEGSEDSIICQIRYSCRRVLELSGSDVCMFECNSVTDRTRPYSAIKTILREVVVTYVRKEKNQNDCLELSVLYKLLDCLLKHYRIETPDAMQKYKMDDSTRMQKIYQYVNQNYQYGVSMSELADQLFLSTSTLSRIFKKQTGIYFADYVAKIRMTHAVDELIHSDNSITKIAVDCGFSNPSVFNRSFKEIYDMTPSDYRSMKREESLKQEQIYLEEQEKLREELAEALKDQTINIAGKVRVTADVTQSRPYTKRWTQVMNLGNIDLMTRAAFQAQALFLKKELDFQYARIWSIFSQRTMLCTGKEGSDYNFSHIDSILKFMVDNGMTPFIDFANRADLAMGELDVTVFKHFDYIPFESKKAWEDCMHSFIEHMIDKFGFDEVNKWKFEFSYDMTNAPGTNYYKDKDYFFRDTFISAYKIIHSYLPDAEVGGPMALIDLEEDLVTEFLMACKEAQTVPDFVSFLLFPYRTYRVGNRIQNDPATSDMIEEEFVRRMQKILLNTGCTDCKLYITEWNNTVSNRNFLNDSSFRGAYFMKKISSLSETVDMLGVWMASDIISNYVDSNRIANGGGGIITKDGIPKPAFYALKFLNQMGSKLIAKGEGYIITESDTGSYYILCYNFKWYSPAYFKKREFIDDPEDLDRVFENNDPMEISITLKNLPKQKHYIVTQRCIAAGYGSLLGEWKKFRFDDQLTDENIRYIRNATYPRISMERKIAVDGCMTLNIPLQAHDFVMLHIHEDKRRNRQ